MPVDKDIVAHYVYQIGQDQGQHSRPGIGHPVGELLVGLEDHQRDQREPYDAQVRHGQPSHRFGLSQGRVLQDGGGKIHQCCQHDPYRQVHRKAVAQDVSDALVILSA